MSLRFISFLTLCHIYQYVSSSNPGSKTSQSIFKCAWEQITNGERGRRGTCQMHIWRIKLSQALWDWTFWQIKVGGEDKQAELKGRAVNRSDPQKQSHVRPVQSHTRVRVCWCACEDVHIGSHAILAGFLKISHPYPNYSLSTLLSFWF